MRADQCVTDHRSSGRGGDAVLPASGGRVLLEDQSSADLARSRSPSEQRWPARRLQRDSVLTHLAPASAPEPLLVDFPSQRLRLQLSLQTPSP